MTDVDQLPEDLIADMREKFEKSFFWACVAIFEHDFESSWLSIDIHKELCDALQDPEKKRLAVVFPRDWLKSTVCSVYYPIWRAMLDDRFQCLMVMNTFTNAKKKMKAIRQLVKGNVLLKQLFPERMPLSSGADSDEAFDLPTNTMRQGSTFEIAGCGTQVTGRHVQCIIEDDTVAPEIDNMNGDVCEPTAEQVEKAVGWHRQAHFILHDFKKDKRIVVGTRWSEKDLFTHIFENEPEYEVITRAVRENPETGEPDMEGELTYPLRFDGPVLKEIADAVGPYMFSALMMNLPINASTRVFQEEWICNYDIEPSDLLCFTTVDPASTEEKVRSSGDPDYSIVLTTGMDTRTGNIYVLDYFRERCNPGAHIGGIIDHVRRFSPIKVGIENIAYQNTLLYWVKEMQNEHKIWFNVEKLEGSHKKKEARIYGLQPLFNRHRIYIKPWMSALRNELLTFPRGAHDDLIDALAYQLGFWQQTDVQREEKKEKVEDRFTGAWLLKSVKDRQKPKVGFPFDSCGSRSALVNRNIKSRGYY